MLSDLRDSGSIEQDADLVMFTYREEYYLRREDPEDKMRIGRQVRLSPDEFKRRMQECQNKAELVIGKNRNGPIKDVRLNCQLKYSKFFDSDDDVPAEPDTFGPGDSPAPPPAPETIPEDF